LKIFYLERIEDESGVSGTGIVAEGVIFKNGRTVVSWMTYTNSINVYDNIETVEAIHGHDGRTLIRYSDEEPQKETKATKKKTVKKK